jgi:hypothetical protein
MSKHDPKVTLRQITDFAQHAQELCTQNELPAILTDWHTCSNSGWFTASRTENQSKRN